MAAFMCYTPHCFTVLVAHSATLKTETRKKTCRRTIIRTLASATRHSHADEHNHVRTFTPRARARGNGRVPPNGACKNTTGNITCKSIALIATPKRALSAVRARVAKRLLQEDS